MNILLFSSLFPNRIHPNDGVFVKQRIAAVQKYFPVNVRVVAPVPWFPSLKTFPRWYHFSQVPEQERMDNLQVYHPRYLVSPKIGMSLYGFSMFAGALPLIRRLQKSFPFDIIDGHYIYPDGFAAVMLGRWFKKPILLTARGTDINLYPCYPVIRSLIRYTLQASTGIVSVSQSLIDVMAGLGIGLDKMQRIPNGIDPTRFLPLRQSDARDHLGISREAKVVLTVGSLIERKGIHLLLEAVSIIKSAGRLRFTTYIVGDGEMRQELELQIDRLGLRDSIKLVGEIPHDQLVFWYNAADIFFLGSSREGWPNVICEALACGLPVVGTNVNGIPEILLKPGLGILVNHRHPDDFAGALITAFECSWDRQRICEYGQSRTWEKVAGEVHEALLVATKSHIL